ncbi:KCNIP4 family protein [Megaselia abdita]
MKQSRPVKTGIPSSMYGGNINERGGGVNALRQIRTDESDLICRGASGGGGTTNSNGSGHPSGGGGSSTGIRSTVRAGENSSDALIAQNNIEIIVDSSLPSSGRNESIDKNKGDDVEQGQKKVKHRHRPLFRRFLSYLKNAFAGTSAAVDSEYEEYESTPRYRPESLTALSRSTRFTEAEIKRIYRGFKAECPTGVVKEETFKLIYSQFFPQGGSCANPTLYAHYVFNALDHEHTGLVSFHDFVHGLSVLSRGSVEEKLQWAFQLYDINGDGFITREEMTDIVTAVYDLMGRLPDEIADEEKIKMKVEKMFQKMDINCDGVVTLEEFIDCCRSDDTIARSITVFDTSF